MKTHHTTNFSTQILNCHRSTKQYGNRPSNYKAPQHNFSNRVMTPNLYKIPPFHKNVHNSIANQQFQHIRFSRSTYQYPDSPTHSGYCLFAFPCPAFRVLHFVSLSPPNDNAFSIKYVKPAISCGRVASRDWNNTYVLRRMLSGPRKCGLRKTPFLPTFSD